MATITTIPPIIIKKKLKPGDVEQIVTSFNLKGNLNVAHMSGSIDFTQLKSKKSKAEIVITNNNKKVVNLFILAGGKAEFPLQRPRTIVFTPGMVTIYVRIYIDPSEKVTVSPNLEILSKGPSNASSSNASSSRPSKKVVNKDISSRILPLIDNKILILLLFALVAVGYLFYSNQGTIKIRSFPRRIARFGQQIKAIQRM
jgi:hypothetical protein